MRTKIYSIVVAILFLVILSGVFYLQVIRWPLYNGLARRNHIRLIPFEGLRGTIYDRNGLAMVENRLSFDVVIIPQEIRDEDALYGRLSNVIGMTKENIKAIVKKRYTAPFAPITIAGDVERNIAFILEEMKQQIPGVLVQSRGLRWYVYGERAGHIIGYLSLINKGELERLGAYGYSVSDMVGRSGVERVYDRYLKGEDGGMQVEVDASGKLVRVLGNKNQNKGCDITLTVDAKLQAYAADCLSGQKGAIVIMNANNGEILAVASSPEFDSNIFVASDKGGQAKELINSKQRPMLNRAISGQYPPGSIFKIIVALAGLESGKITEHTTFVCDGKYRMGNAEFACWKDEGHGPQDISAAITHSCNVYFYNLGHKLGPDVIAEYAQKFGLGRSSGIDLTGEASGLVPTPAWKRAKKNESWFEGETVNFAIGQGPLLVTPLQMAGMVSVFANGGSLPKPHLIKKIGDSETVPPKPKVVSVVSRKNLEIIKNAMLKVVESDTGTGQRARVEGVRIAAKTGTAQNPRGDDHAWFLGYAPADNPKISLVVLVEHGGKGGLIGADIAKKLLEFIRDNTDLLNH